MDICNKIIENTKTFIEMMPKSSRKNYGQFFTSLNTARYMASLFEIPKNKESVSILDPGAGSGILAAALIERLENESQIKKISLTCYETDINIVGLLENNLELLQIESKKIIEIHLRKENYITTQAIYFPNGKSSVEYDLIIGNPPYKKIPKEAEEAVSMPSVCYGAPNLYFLFSSMSLFNLKNDGEMVYIIPRSWTSGAYFRKFREYFLKEGKLIHIHLFESRNKIFGEEDVLQETIIIKVKKTNIEPEYITISSTPDSKTFEKADMIKVKYDIVVSGRNSFVFLITKQSDINTLSRINKNKDTLPDIGMKMKTGLTVDFRTRDLLRNNIELGVIPLFYSQHIRNGMVEFPINKENEYIIANIKGLLQENKNYLFVKRFTSKEEKRRFQCGIYLSKRFPSFSKISTQNKLNFIDGISDNLSEEMVYGLYCLFNSTLYDNYYRILNGSTQVNSTEVNTIPIPQKDVIISLGKELIEKKNLSQETCDQLLEAYNV